MMFDKICTRLCLHTRAARIAFFSSLIFIMSVTVLAALALYEPQAMVPPPAVAGFSADELHSAFQAEFGSAEGTRLFSLAKELAEAGDSVLAQYGFLPRERPTGKTLTAEAARQSMLGQRETWSAEAGILLNASHPHIKALAEDIEEAQQLALDGMARWTPFINQRVFKARGMFHDLANVLLAEEKSNRYFGETRLGRLVEQEGRP